MEIFVSRPSWVPSEFERGLHTFETQLRNMRLTPRTLGVSDYPTRSPLDEVIGIMDSCDGAVILGYPQINVVEGSIKGQPIETEVVLGTEWNHLEAGLAYAQGLPILIIHHHSVTRGIFDRGVLNAFLHSVDMSKPSWSMQAETNGAIEHWREACAAGQPSYVQSNAQVSARPDKPVCPHCSTMNKRVYLNPIGKVFQNMAGGEWECAQCRYVE